MMRIIVLVTAIGIGMAWAGTADPDTDLAENMTQPVPAQGRDVSCNPESAPVPANSRATNPVRHCGGVGPNGGCPRGYCCMRGLCYLEGDCV